MDIYKPYVTDPRYELAAELMDQLKDSDQKTNSQCLIKNVL